MNVICRIVGHRPTLTNFVFGPTPELCEEYDEPDMPTLWFTVESCERYGRWLRVGLALPGEQVELESPEIAASRVAWLKRSAIAQAFRSLARRGVR